MRSIAGASASVSDSVLPCPCTSFGEPLPLAIGPGGGAVKNPPWVGGGLEGGAKAWVRGDGGREPWPCDEPRGEEFIEGTGECDGWLDSS